MRATEAAGLGGTDPDSADWKPVQDAGFAEAAGPDNIDSGLEPGLDSGLSSGFGSDSEPGWDWRSDTHTGLGWDSEKSREVGRIVHLQEGCRSKEVRGGL